MVRVTAMVRVLMGKRRRKKSEGVNATSDHLWRLIGLCIEGCQRSGRLAYIRLAGVRLATVHAYV